mmetsp:Transcript_9814/g.16127  ORF Transcript_9814/g.16127 Transcript_9814/m.16127 type:complete len:366 (+) Transcript_9814:100-1197(+)|eukprot:CAMPEP_0184351586 /NCGR_PEP_ID=MMETSP1089-20130417/43728_1 /TAXON_ID=38269 ORGANISM="Gloeochaete wittrockiana, Strain SAG46.84" /NCGR_SAMPLE_ID=MMETSP1089 /ASSEMBLY_ACC=CAM_ASM_000445 /LENGTH=365 /DNA_ID=CAMNT_0026684991 /DNA_START=92 /DNA_END=1189 /DNA_ORIENTATION=-
MDPYALLLKFILPSVSSYRVPRSLQATVSSNSRSQIRIKHSSAKVHRSFYVQCADFVPDDCVFAFDAALALPVVQTPFDISRSGHVDVPSTVRKEEKSALLNGTSGSDPQHLPGSKDELPSDLISSQVPRHVAVIMDGNGRWAQRRNMPRIAGHARGVDAFRGAVRLSAQWGIQALTVFALSTENLFRQSEEVEFLMELFRSLLETEASDLMRQNVKVRFIGDPTALPSRLQAQMTDTQLLTANNSGLRLTIALNYGGRQDVVRTCRQIAEMVQQGKISPEQIDETMFNQQMSTAFADVDHDALPDPDLLIRSGGELRLSNFLLWQCAYSEFYVTETLWPDFGREQLHAALLAYQQRQRRFGRVP